MPGTAVFVISSMGGKFGTRSPMFLRIAASSANASGTSASARTRAEAARDDRFMANPSGVERSGGEPALQGRDAVDETEAIVAEFADRCRGRREQTQQTVGHLTHCPRRCRALPPIPPEQPFVADAAPGFASGDDGRQGGDVREAEIEALSGERMNDVRGIADEDPARPAPRARGDDDERPRRALRAERQRAWRAAGRG